MTTRPKRPVTSPARSSAARANGQYARRPAAFCNCCTTSLGRAGTRLTTSCMTTSRSGAVVR
ncbi:hypothetical protein [Nonomuraea sp. NPDC005692]|uniref:hypothetical protein n=1 Tax=Nonomuraea sp. NPDC005692 TaxID=3157168 RepID=UPI0033DDE0FF